MKEKEPGIDLLRLLDPKRGESDFSRPRAGGDKPETVAVMVGSQYMGRGDEELGSLLAASFFDVIAAVGRPPAVITFYNTGVFLTTREGPALDSLKALAAQGSILLSSGICLDFFNIKSQLKVGRIGNMYELINAQRTADRIIRM